MDLWTYMVAEMVIERCMSCWQRSPACVASPVNWALSSLESGLNLSSRGTSLFLSCNLRPSFFGQTHASVTARGWSPKNCEVPTSSMVLQQSIHHRLSSWTWWSWEKQCIFAGLQSLLVKLHGVASQPTGVDPMQAEATRSQENVWRV